jgi:hypothetical protein
LFVGDGDLTTDLVPPYGVPSSLGSSNPPLTRAAKKLGSGTGVGEPASAVGLGERVGVGVGVRAGVAVRDEDGVPGGVVFDGDVGSAVRAAVGSGEGVRG